MIASETDERIKAAREHAAREFQVDINAFHRVFKSDDGRTVVAYLERFFETHKSAFRPKPDGSYDPYEAAKRDGARAVICEIDAMLNLPCQGDANVQSKQKVIRE